jgi:two-component system OmpR family response regulator
MRLLLIEDDELLGSGLRDFLRVDGHVVEWARQLGEIDAYRGEPFDAYLLDWQLPDGSGLEWLSARRERGDVTPVLMLTARDLLEDRLRGLDSGADDYIVKPFAPEEMVARVRAICRRRAGSAGARVRVGAVEVDLISRCAWLNSERTELTSREWSVLEALMLRFGRIVSKAELERLVLGFESELASNAIEVHVSSLRRKLGRELVETVRGMGYRVGGPA